MKKEDKAIFIEKFIRSFDKQVRLAKNVGFYKEIFIRQGKIYIFSLDRKNFFYYIPDNITEILSENELYVTEEFGITLFGIIDIKIDRLIVVGGRNLETCIGLFLNCKADIIDLTALSTSKLSSMKFMFVSANINKIKMGTLDISHTNDLSCLLAHSNINNLDFTDFDTFHIKNMSSMFQGAAIVNLSIDFDTHNVTDMSYMFNGATISKSDISKLDTESCETMQGMFRDFYCMSFLDFTNFSTSKVRNMSEMFCQFEDTAVADGLDLTNFDTSNVEDMSRMFAGIQLEYMLDLSNFDMSKVKNAEKMFYVSKFAGINLGDFKLDLKRSKTSQMFEFVVNYDFQFDSENSEIIELYNKMKIHDYEVGLYVDRSSNLNF